MQEIPRLTPSCGSFDADKRGPRSSSELDREKVMLHIDDNFVVINKPHDLRMDGDHELTVQKLLLEWIEGSSLSDLKWVHQLDYATSGTLAVARTRKMAGYASNSFELCSVSGEFCEFYLSTCVCKPRSRMTRSITTFISNDPYTVVCASQQQHCAGPDLVHRTAR